jgi:hypothetical protein
MTPAHTGAFQPLSGERFTSRFHYTRADRQFLRGGVRLAHTMTMAAKVLQLRQ